MFAFVSTPLFFLRLASVKAKVKAAKTKENIFAESKLWLSTSQSVEFKRERD